MKQYFKTTMLLFAAITLGVSIHAQVIIGIDEMPEKGAALEVRNKNMKNDPPVTLADMENSDKGILFPKVRLVAGDSLYPLYTGTVSAANKLLATGMIVYNVATVEGINAGLAQWNGSEWISLARTGSLAAVSCNPTSQVPVKVNGYYTKGVALTPQSCMLVVPVQVDKVGAYSAQAIVREGNTVQEATFSFAGSGEFTRQGLNYITLTGYGVPTNSTEDNIGNENTIEIFVNEKQLVCSYMPTIYVDKTEARFSFICTSVRIQYPIGKNSITQGQAINPSDVYITLDLMSNSPNAEYHIETDSINGVHFSGNGILGAGKNSITLEGKGTPDKSGTYTYTITGNDANHSAVCTVNLNVAYNGKGIKVLLFSSNTESWNIGHEYAVIPQMLQADSLFDFGSNANAPFHIENKNNITVEHSTTVSGYTTLAKLMNYHLVVVSYTVIPSQDMADALCEYVKAGRTCLFTVDYHDNNDIINRIINKLSNISALTTKHTTENLGHGDDAIAFLGGNLAVNGQYMDLTGKKLGRDGSGNFLFENLPDDWVVLASNSVTDPRNNAKLIMHKKYRMFLSGDGGIFSGGNSSLSGYNTSNYHAAWVDANGVPMICTKSPWDTVGKEVYNAHFLANLLIWAFEAVVE
jgi:hypothetical protein